METGDEATDDDDRFVTVAETTDGVRAQMLEDLLADSGIPATIAGSHHSNVLGIGHVNVHVQVPASQAKAARALIEALDEEDSELIGDGDDIEALRSAHRAERGRYEDDEAGDGPYRSAAVDEPDRPERLKRVAVAIAFLVPGLGFGHHYARESSSGLALMIGTAGVVLAGCGGSPGAAMTAFVLMWIYDIVGAPYAARRYNEQRPWAATQQLLVTGAFVALAFALGYLASPDLTVEPPP